VTPLEKDFLRADAKLIESIFAEVTEPPGNYRKIIREAAVISGRTSHSSGNY